MRYTGLYLENMTHTDPVLRAIARSTTQQKNSPAIGSRWRAKNQRDGRVVRVTDVISASVRVTVLSAPDGRKPNPNPTFMLKIFRRTFEPLP